MPKERKNPLCAFCGKPLEEGRLLMTYELLPGRPKIGYHMYTCMIMESDYMLEILGQCVKNRQVITDKEIIKKTKSLPEKELVKRLLEIEKRGAGRIVDSSDMWKTL